jgi:hypothetical protein
MQIGSNRAESGNQFALSGEIEDNSLAQKF